MDWRMRMRGCVGRRLRDRGTWAGVCSHSGKVREVLDVAHRVVSIKLGQVAFSGRSDDLKDNKEKLKDLFL